MMCRSLLLLVALLVCGAFATTPRSQAQLNTVPGLPYTPGFSNYAGYITLANTTKNIFYWFVTAQSNSATAPTVLWLQGGPGCSGLAGFFSENGPYFPNVLDYTLQTVGLKSSFYAWNRVANMIYIESPCGVGFSYSTNPMDYHTNDNQTAIDNYLFLQGFFELYPEFANNPLWITGESYGGVYIPTLAYQILTNSSSPSLAAALRKGGLTLGNPVTGCDGDAFQGEADVLNLNDKVNLFYWHAMISRHDYDLWNNNSCNVAKPPSIGKCFSIYLDIAQGLSFDQPLASMRSTRSTDPAPAVRSQNRLSTAPRLQERNGDLNPDCLYYSYCTDNVTMDFNTAILPGCFGTSDQISTYLNNATVQKAINAQPHQTWSTCGGVFYNRNVGSLMPYLDQIFSISPTTRILYYAGDIDIATVPFAPTQRCLATLNRPIKKKWHAYTINKEVAGYVEQYDTYTFATIKGAGHEAPGFQPAAAFLLWTSFVNGTVL